MRVLIKPMEMCQPIGRKGSKLKREQFSHSLSSKEFAIQNIFNR
jgi:hypothetical protein